MTAIKTKSYFAALMLALTTLIVVALLPAGCAAPPTYTGPPLKIRLGIQPGPQSTLIWVAEKEGLFKKHDLEVALRRYDVGYNAVKGLGSDESDVATGTEFAFISNAFSQPGLRVIASIAQGDTTSFVGRRDRGINSVADLAGKRIAVSPGVINQFLLGKYLALNGIGQGAVTLVNMDEQSAKRAVEEGTVDAAVLFEPDVQEARDALGSNAYVVDIQSGQDYFWLLTSTAEYVAGNSDAVLRLLAAMVDAERFTQANPTAAQRDLQSATGLSKSYVRYVWPKYTFTVSLDQALVLAMEDEARWTIENGLFSAKAVPNYLDYIYLEGLRRLAPLAVTIY
jgi:NitT/TauT family transport system substrate-binding protein